MSWTSSALVEKTRHALETGQVNLAMTYARRWETVRLEESVERHHDMANACAKLGKPFQAVQHRFLAVGEVFCAAIASVGRSASAALAPFQEIGRALETYKAEEARHGEA